MEIVESAAAQKKTPPAKPVNYRKGIRKLWKSPENSAKKPSPTKRKKTPATA
jgi:hypothetical protein